MWTKWTQNLKSEQDRIEFERSFQSARPVLDRAIDILNEREKALTNRELDLKSFGSPSWPYLQAALVGARAELRNLKILFTTLDQKELNDFTRE
jgi:hypothetical protein